MSNFERPSVVTTLACLIFLLTQVFQTQTTFSPSIFRLLLVWANISLSSEAETEAASAHVTRDVREDKSAICRLRRSILRAWFVCVRRRERSSLVLLPNQQLSQV